MWAAVSAVATPPAARNASRAVAASPCIDARAAGATVTTSWNPAREMPRHDERVAAVVARAREHHDGPTALAEHGAGDLHRRQPGSFHQGLVPMDVFEGA